MGRQNWRQTQRLSRSARGVKIAIGMSDSGFALPEYRPYTLIPPVSGPKGVSTWMIIGAVIAIGAVAGLVVLVR